MRIVVNDIAASTGGAMTVLRDFYSCVCENDHENEWIFLLNQPYFQETENVKIITLPEIKKSGLRKAILKKYLTQHLALRKSLHRLRQIGIGTIITRDEASHDRHYHLGIDTKKESPKAVVWVR